MEYPMQNERTVPTMKVDMGSCGNRIENMNYPGNSKIDKKEKVVNRVVKTPVVKKKTNIWKNFINDFVKVDMPDIAEYVLYDVLVPAIKSAISDMVRGGVQMLLFGNNKGDHTRREAGRSYVSYNNYSSNNTRRDTPSNREPQSARTSGRYNFDDFPIGSRGDAEQVLSHLVDLTIDYGQATVADFYDLIGVRGNFTDNKYGWIDLSRSSISRIREGYIINLSKPIQLD